MVLCEKLGKTLSELDAGMNESELRLWIAFHDLRRAEKEKRRR